MLDVEKVLYWASPPSVVWFSFCFVPRDDKRNLLRWLAPYCCLEGAFAPSPVHFTWHALQVSGGVFGPLQSEIGENSCRGPAS